MNLSKIQLPNQKEWAAGIAGLVTWLILLGLGYAGVSVPVEVQTGITGLVTVLIAKLVPASDVDIVKRVNDTIVQAGTAIGNLTPASDSTQPPTAAAKALAAKVQ